MVNRTIKELHDREIGHLKFAKVCDLLVKKGHDVTNIKECYEKFKFEVDDYYFEYPKNWRRNTKEYVDYLLDILENKKKIERIMRH